MANLESKKAESSAAAESSSAANESSKNYAALMEQRQAIEQQIAALKNEAIAEAEANFRAAELAYNEAKKALANLRGLNIAESSKRANNGAIAPYKAFLMELIAEAKYSQKAILELCAEQFSQINKATISTTLSDCKNPKYRSLPKLAKIENGVMCFAEL